MGHERIGTLPKTERWRSIVSRISNYTDAEDTIIDIASQTTKNVRSRFQYIEEDRGVFAAFKFIITLTHFSKSDKALEDLAQRGINLPKDFGLYDLAFCTSEYISQNSDSKEYQSFATHSIIETISEWAKTKDSGQLGLFDANNRSLELWRQASDGSGFCELSRLFFSKFTERYLMYFLEREAATAIDNLFDRTMFNKNLEGHIQRISQHAFETSKITQSFAAAWYNKYAKTKFPSDKKIQGFLSFAFKKINSELIKEETSDD